MKTYNGDREKCYNCYRPKSSCMCEYVHKIKTNTKFIILMHPKEFKKIKNGTGHLTHLALPNSKLFVGIDFTNHEKINNIIATHKSFVLYPSKDAINLNITNPHAINPHAINPHAINSQHAINSIHTNMAIFPSFPTSPLGMSTCI